MKPKTYIFYVKEPPLSEQKINNAAKLYFRMKELVKSDQESFWVVGFNGGNKEIYNECLFIGGIDYCTIDIKLLFKRILTIGATGFIVVHNHPGGLESPSRQDRELTDKIKKVADIIGIRFLDHVIIGDDGYYSFKEHLLLN